MKKREKELARVQKARDKAAKRLARKNGQLTSEDSDTNESDAANDFEPETEPQESSSLTTLP